MNKIWWTTESGADSMKLIAAPMIGGILTSFLFELVVFPLPGLERAHRSEKTMRRRQRDVDNLKREVNFL